MLTRFRQVGGPQAQLVNQYRILDCDNRLVTKNLDELYMLPGEWPHLLAIDDDDAYQLVILEHRDKRPAAPKLDRGDGERVAFDVGPVGDNVVDEYRPFCPGRTSSRCFRAGYNNRLAPEEHGMSG